mmetsp:Transcript_27539/g.42172  ORF Transcript_27539/g.42172 Transcript_27539/m.42172 type:complete len:210 (-) Transcript_27539:102-731(-)
MVAFLNAFNSSTMRWALIHNAPPLAATFRIRLSSVATISDPVNFPSVTLLASKHRFSIYPSALIPAPEYTILTPLSVTFLEASMSTFEIRSRMLALPGASPNIFVLTFLPYPSKTISMRHPLRARISSMSWMSVSRALDIIPLFIHFFNRGHLCMMLYPSTMTRGEDAVALRMTSQSGSWPLFCRSTLASSNSSSSSNAFLYAVLLTFV